MFEIPTGPDHNPLRRNGIMADANDTRAAIAAASYEAEVLSSTIVAAVEALRNLPEAASITDQLGVVHKLATQLSEIVDRLADLLREHFRPVTQ
jgi:hypothetical protein